MPFRINEVFGLIIYRNFVVTKQKDITMNIDTTNLETFLEVEDTDTLEGIDEVLYFIKKRREKPSFFLPKAPCKMEMPINALF